MTYSQIWNNSGHEADILYLEQQIKAVKQEMRQAEAAGLHEEWSQFCRNLVELEAKLDELED